MKYRAPIIQQGMTRAEAQETRNRYLRLNPGALVSIDAQPDNPKLHTLIVRLPLLPKSAIRAECLGRYNRWRD